MENRNNGRLGPFAVAGTILNTFATTAVVVDTAISSSGAVLTQGLSGIDTVVAAGTEALTIVTESALEDLRTDEIVESAYRQVRVAEARAEAARIIAAITPSTHTDEATTKGN